jgi:drug/metabolite transporter (DMT)-like permease
VGGRPVGGSLATLTAVVLWGAQLPIGAVILQRIDPLHLTALRYSFAVVFLVPVLVWIEGADALRYRGRFWKATGIGLLGMCLSPILTFTGLSLSSPEHAATISALQPLMVAATVWSMRGRRPASFTLWCMVVALGGVLVVVGSAWSAGAAGFREVAGDVVIVGGSISWVAYVLASAQLSRLSTLAFTTLTLIPAAIAIQLLVAVLGAAGLLSWPPLPVITGMAWPLLYMSLGGVVIAMLCWNEGNRRIGPLNAMLFINFQPVVTFVVRFLEGSRFRVMEVVGATIVVGALVANTLYLRRIMPPPTVAEPRPPEGAARPRRRATPRPPPRSA